MQYCCLRPLEIKNVSYLPGIFKGVLLYERDKPAIGLFSPVNFNYLRVGVVQRFSFTFIGTNTSTTCQKKLWQVEDGCVSKSRPSWSKQMQSLVSYASNLPGNKMTFVEMNQDMLWGSYKREMVFAVKVWFGHYEVLIAFLIIYFLYLPSQRPHFNQPKY